MIKNIIFDIGNVLLSFSPIPYLNQYYNPIFSNRLSDIIFKSDEWIELDKGTILIKDAIASLSKKHPYYVVEINYILTHWTDMLTPINENVELLSTLKEKGYNLYLLSNFHIEAFDTVTKQNDFFSYFDGGVVSGHIQMLKPDPSIYKTLINKYNLKNEECLFVDDCLDNIIEARNQNIQGIHLPVGTSLYHQLKLHDLI